MKHIRIIPDCPNCGNELKGYHKMSEPTVKHPYGTKVDGWWECPNCGYESEHFDRRPYDDVKEEIVPNVV